MDMQTLVVSGCYGRYSFNLWFFRRNYEECFIQARTSFALL